MATKIATQSTYENRYNNHASNVKADVKANPGSSAADIQTSLGINATNTEIALSFWVKEGVIVEKDDAGVFRYWVSEDWTEDLRALVDVIETHLNTVDDPDTLADISTAIGESELKVEEAGVLGENLGILNVIRI